MKNKTPTLYDLSIQTWYAEMLIYSDHFFDTTASLNAADNDTNLTAVYYELRMIRDSFEAADYPSCATKARLHLLKSMSQVMLGFQQFIAGNEEAAHRSLREAQVELYNLDAALGKMGAASRAVPQHMH